MDQLMVDYIELALKHNDLPNLENMDVIYAKTREGSSLRRCVLHAFHFVMNGASRTERNLAYWTTASLHELMIKHPPLSKDYIELVRKSPVGKVAMNTTKMSRCLFQQHGEDEGCSLK